MLKMPFCQGKSEKNGIVTEKWEGRAGVFRSKTVSSWKNRQNCENSLKAVEIFVQSGIIERESGF
jgi:hypothetical protein